MTDRGWIPFIDQVLEELAVIEGELQALLNSSQVRYVNPNGRGSGVFVLGAADYGWAPSDDAQMRTRMALGRRYRPWRQRVTMLEDGATHELRKQIDAGTSVIERWIERPRGYDHKIPRTIDEAKQVASKHVAMVRAALVVIGGGGSGGFHVVPDTSALLRQPDLATYADAVGAEEVMIHLVPTVLGEIDKLKDQGRTPDVRDRAAALTRRIKGLRDRGKLTEGVLVQGRIKAIADPREPSFEHLPDWLDPATPDDRILASALVLQATNPTAVVVLVAADMNIQNKAEACAMPYREPFEPKLAVAPTDTATT